MRATRLRIALGAFPMVLAACGGGAGTTTTVIGASASSTVSAPAATTTATTAPSSTTTLAPTTTLGADVHPVLGLTWAEVWPHPSKTAVYRVKTFEDTDVDLPARMEYGVEFAGGRYDRLVVGTPEPGNYAMVVYFDRSDPWQIKIIGEEDYFESVTTGPEAVYLFEEPIVFDGFTEIGGTAVSEGDVEITFGPGDVMNFGVTYEVTLRTIEPVTVAAGEFDALVVDVLVGGELMGGDFTFPVEMWLNSEQFLLWFEGASGFQSLELAEAWA